MSAEMDSSTEAVTVFVRLLDEGTDVWRPAPAERLSGGVYRLLRPEDYDPENEQWEFAPGRIVVCEPQTRGEQQVLVVTHKA